jgi:hypothetical protein
VSFVGGRRDGEEDWRLKSLLTTANTTTDRPIDESVNYRRRRRRKGGGEQNKRLHLLDGLRPSYCGAGIDLLPLLLLADRSTANNHDTMLCAGSGVKRAACSGHDQRRKEKRCSSADGGVHFRPVSCPSSL